MIMKDKVIIIIVPYALLTCSKEKVAALRPAPKHKK